MLFLPALLTRALFCNYVVYQCVLLSNYIFGGGEVVYSVVVKLSNSNRVIVQQ